jgi:hypothetical protein
MIFAFYKGANSLVGVLFCSIVQKKPFVCKTLILRPAKNIEIFKVSRRLSRCKVNYSRCYNVQDRFTHIEVYSILKPLYMAVSLGKRGC